MTEAQHKIYLECLVRLGRGDDYYRQKRRYSTLWNLCNHVYFEERGAKKQTRAKKQRKTVRVHPRHSVSPTGWRPVRLTEQVIFPRGVTRNSYTPKQLERLREMNVKWSCVWPQTQGIIINIGIGDLLEIEYFSLSPRRRGKKKVWVPRGSVVSLQKRKKPRRFGS